METVSVDVEKQNVHFLTENFLSLLLLSGLTLLTRSVHLEHYLASVQSQTPAGHSQTDYGVQMIPAVLSSVQLLTPHDRIFQIGVQVKLSSV
jgi:hypothetical protein